MTQAENPGKTRVDAERTLGQLVARHATLARRWLQCLATVDLQPKKEAPSLRKQTEGKADREGIDMSNTTEAATTRRRS